MNEQSRKMLDAYYRDAASWNSDRTRSLRLSQRVAWIVAAGTGLIAVLEAGALLLLTPLKTVEPYTLLVDKTTGYVQPLKPLEPSKVAPDAALTQSFLVQYVIARESFDIATAGSAYRKVALFSTGEARSGYLTAMQVSNPQSPLTVYPRGTTVETRVKSVSPVGRDAALVRFDTIRTDPNGRSQPARPWVTLVRYRYSSEPMKLEDRFVNPLGFQVVHYRRDPEAFMPEAAPAAAASAPSSAPLPGTVAALPVGGAGQPPGATIAPVRAQQP
jgi:type IV secretion system protein VirB8